MQFGRMLRTVGTLVPGLLAILALVHPVASAFARRHWLLDLVSHLQELAFLLSLAAAAGLLVIRRPRLSVPFFILASFQCEPLIHYSLSNPVQPASKTAPRLRILMANVLADNADFRALDQLIRQSDPDIVALVETSINCFHGLKEVRKTYPYHVDFAFGPQGLSLWFKQKPYRIDPPALPTHDGWPYLRATFRFADTTRHLWLIHPASPFRRRGRFPGFPDLAALGDRIHNEPGSHILIGDFNTTDGSPYFRDLLAKTGLHDSRLGFGRQGSWPVGSPYMIAIDHALVSGDLAVVSRRLGPSIGSDHRPLIVDLAPAANESSTAETHDSTSAK